MTTLRPFHRCCLSVLPLGMLLVFAGGMAQAEDAEKFAFFESRIRPMLVKHCYECHSTGSKEVKGSLVVDTAAGLLKGGDSGPSIVIGKPDESPLIEALRYDGLEMPPAGKLPEQVLKDFEHWVKIGAPDPRAGEVVTADVRTIDIEQGRKFWAFQPVADPAIPDTLDTTWPRSSLDAFTLSRLEQAGLKPADDADRAVLVRRLYFDLTGLPPTPEQLAAAVADTAPDAIAQLVDRLLESPQYGEHWARHWLDVARYADSNGSDFNATFHNAWRYRNYVIRAMNEDKPYNQFVREQIAGDLLPYESDAQRTEQVVATGFLMLGTKMLSERDKLKLQMDVVDEQINTVGSAFMGLTLGCARCHDHKFDPIPTRDYYALAGIFRSTRTLQGESQQYVSTWKKVPLPAPAEQVAVVEQYEQQTKELKAQIAAAKKALDTAEARVKEIAAGNNSLTVDDADAELAGNWKKSTYSSNFVGRGYIHDDMLDKGEKTVEFRLEIPKSANYEVRMSYNAAAGRAKRVPVAIQHSGGEAEVFVDQTKKPNVDGLYQRLGNFLFEAGKIASVTISTTGTTGHVIVDAVQFVEVDPAGKPVVDKSAAESPMAETAKAEAKNRKAEVEQLDKQLEALVENAPEPLPLAFAPGELEPDDCEICIRGEHRNLGSKVPRGFVQVAMSSDQQEVSPGESGRRELADWMASAKHPLTSRVMVNRIWQHLLGEGIVRSVDNFGELGQRPTHPELLDHLAHRFATPVDAGGWGWSIKSLVREITLSRTYQMSSKYDEESWQTDPENRLLWRANLRRLPAEAIRDSMLAISAAIDYTPGESPVPGLGTLVNNNSADAKAFQRSQSSKRSVYLAVIRSELPPILTVFDFADPDLVVGKRPVTNVPAQALLLMNSPFVMDCAKQTAQRLTKTQAASPQLLVESTYQLVVSRTPTDAEVQRALAFLQLSDEPSLPAGDDLVGRLTQFVHVLLASTEFRNLD